ncbi:MAG: ABC transporter substrate-binding protein [Xanthobacteraceae bacterium]
MRRRDFIRLIGGAAAAWPAAAPAQQANKVPKVGFLYPGPEAMAAKRSPLLLDGLLSEGFHAPDQLMLVSRATGGDPARLAPLLKELVAVKVDVLVPLGPAATRAARSATASIPIVAADLESDPIESGWLASLAHPGGNLTGFFLDFPDFSTKWLGLLKETVPGLASVVVLWDPATGTIQTKAIAAAAKALNIKIEIMEIKAPGEIEAVLDAASQRSPDGLLFLSSPFFSAYTKQFAELTLKHHLPAIAFFSIFPRAGGLMSYGPNLDALYRELGVMAGKVLKGTKPADLPAERPSRFELVVNLKTAKALNLKIPDSIQLLADEVIE